MSLRSLLSSSKSVFVRMRGDRVDLRAMKSLTIKLELAHRIDQRNLWPMFRDIFKSRYLEIALSQSPQQNPRQGDNEFVPIYGSPKLQLRFADSPHMPENWSRDKSVQQTVGVASCPEGTHFHAGVSDLFMWDSERKGGRGGGRKKKEERKKMQVSRM
jgi:hypothetical protein